MVVRVGSRIRHLLVLAAALGALAMPAPSVADHVGIQASASATLKSLSPSSATVEVSFSITCTGASGEPFYFGSLRLVDMDTLEETYLGGVSGASGSSTLSVSRGERDRRVQTRLRASCGDAVTLHGSPFIEVNSDGLVIPARGQGGGGGGGGNGGGGGGGSGGADPDDPLRPGGCAIELRGSAGPDVLDGGPGGDLILALGGSDRVRGRAGHDCLVGSSGRDRLLGEDGSDRLTGGAGRDRLEGGPGRNAYDAGSGNDRIKARNRRRETVRCGPGEDTASADRNDRLRGCEHVVRPS